MHWFVLAFGLFVWASGTAAKPILSDSQKSYTAACLGREEPLRRLPGICSAALEEQGGSQAQRNDVKTVLADVLSELDETEKARRLYEEVVSDEPRHTDALNGLAWIAWDEDDYAKASQLFQQSLDVKPTAQGLAGQGSSLRRGNSIEQEAFVAMMDAALAISPNYTWALREKAWGLVSFRDYEAAEESARAALDQDKDSLPTIYLLGFVLNEMGQWKEAYGFLNTGVEMEGTTTFIYWQRALASLNLGYYKIALKDAERVIADWPDDSRGYVGRARALSALGRRADAIEELERFLERGYDAFAGYWLAEFHYMDENFEAASRTLEKTFLLDEPDYFDHEFMALIRIELDQFDAARPHIAAAQELRPESSYPYYYEALFHVSQGAYDRADEIMLRSVALGLPENSQSNYIAELTRKGEFVRAIRMRIAFREG